MYSGTTLTPLKWFDAWFGAHQKIDRVARAHLATVFEGRGYYFPSAWQVLKFEGQNGPDGIKRKSPGQDEPWHYYDPKNPKDDRVLKIIAEHYELLVTALRERNLARAAFEAAWLSHAVVDGLTPAHQYPYEEELIRLRGGNSIETRTTVKEKLVMHGDTVSQQVGNNWQMWGDKGLLATHFAFEWGVAVIIIPLRLRRGMPSDADLFEFRQKGVLKGFHDAAQDVANLKMYEEFYKSGWTPKLAKQVRRQLAPMIVNTVTATWYCAVLDSQQTKRSRQTRNKV